MIAAELISNNIPPLKSSDNLTTVLNWMRDFHVIHLPVIEKGKYLGTISEDDLLDVMDGDLSISDSKITLSPISVPFSDHIYEVMQKVTENKMTTIPVLDKDENFLGLITAQNLILYFADMSSIKNPGSIVVLQMKSKDYSLHEISRLVESNDASILSAIISYEDVENDKIELTLKINQQDISAITATFERYDYTVKNIFQESEYTDVLKDRYDSFMNWIDI